MSARQQAEALLAEATGTTSRDTKAAVAQGYAILALADAIERHTEQLVESVGGPER